MLLALPLLWGCQEPFGTDRHDLVGDRIAAVNAVVDGDRVQPQLALFVDGRPWSAAPLDIQWYWIEAAGDASALTDADTPVDTGPAPSLTMDGERLAVRVHFPSGEKRAEVDLGDARSTLRLDAAVLPGLALDGLEAEALALDARRGLTTESGRVVAPGGFVRFELTGAEADSTGRFMATGGGTFFELDATRADWVAGHVVVDGDTLEGHQPLPPGGITALAVEVGARAGFAATELHVGDAPLGLWVRNRFSHSEERRTGKLWASLWPDDASPTGVRYRDFLPAEVDTFDAQELGCEGLGMERSFDPNWLLTGQCARDDLAGQRVLLEIDP